MTHTAGSQVARGTKTDLGLGELNHVLVLGAVQVPTHTRIVVILESGGHRDGSIDPEMGTKIAVSL